jgi:GR25 family glycosyltransferase involved in LPS biosynthesis
MTKSAIALTKTTLQILKEAERLALPKITIFEDDVVPHFIDKETVGEWQARKKEFDEALPAEWDMAFYGMDHVFRPIETEKENVRIAQYGYGCHAYSVNKHMYSKLIDLLSKHVNTLPIGVLYAEYVMPDNHVYVPKQNLFKQGGDSKSDTS